jgi:hypothetical protein
MIYDLEKTKVAFDDNSPQRSSLRCGPGHFAPIRNNSQVLSPSPELTQSAFLPWVSILADKIRKSSFLRGLSKAMNSGVISNINGEIMSTGLEEDSISKVTELAVVGRIHPTLSRMDLIENVLRTRLTRRQNFHLVCVPNGRIWLSSKSHLNKN